MKLHLMTVPEDVSIKQEDMLLQAFQQQEKEMQVLGLRRRKLALSHQELQTKYEQRWECARQIRAMHYYLESASPAVFASAVRIMDSALMKVNIPWKYLSCFSAACYFIGSKWIEDEYQPMVPVLTDLHYKQWKQVDLRRMEEKVLGVLAWKMPRCTYMSFLPEMTKILSQCQVLLPPISYIIRKAEMLLIHEFSFMFSPAAVALGILEHCCCQPGLCSENLSNAVAGLQDFVRIQDSEIQKIDQILNAENNQHPVVYKCNKAYFPKVLENPLYNFCPDYRLHDIQEESNIEADLSMELLCASISDSYCEEDSEKLLCASISDSYCEEDSDSFHNDTDDSMADSSIG